MPKALDIVLDVDADGHLDRRRALWIRDQLALYAGGQVRLRMSLPQQTSRSSNYYWVGVIKPIRVALMEAGHPVEAEVLHERFKKKYLPPRVVKVFGREEVLPPSTANLDQTAFYDYVQSIKYDEDVKRLGVWFESMPGSLRSFSIEEVG